MVFFLSPNIEVGQFAKEPESEETNKGALCLSNRAKPTFGGVILDNVQADLNSCFPELCSGGLFEICANYSALVHFLCIQKVLSKNLHDPQFHQLY